MPNPSFEEIVSCPTMESQIYLAEPWFQPIMCSFGNVDDCSSSDLFNSCHIPNPPFANVDVPSSDFGYQVARTGQGYAGIAIWHDNGARERIEVPLLDSLIEKKTYCVKMYVVNKRTIGGASLSTSSSNLQFLLTSDSLIDNHPTGEVYYTPSVSNPDSVILEDTLNWVEVSGCYLALGGEKFLTIGNFYDNSNSNVSDPTKFNAYYLIDDVSVELYDGTNCNCPEYDTILPIPPDLSFSLPNVFSPNNDNVNDLWTTNFIDDSEYVIILNRWGIEVASLNIDQPEWNGKTNGQTATDGVYFYQAFLRGEYKTGFIHLVR